jgi:hypothetical protein
MTPHPSIRRMHKLRAGMRRLSDARLDAAIVGAEAKFAQIKLRDTGDAAHHLAVLIWDLRGERSDRANRDNPISGRPGHPGYERFRAIAESWGYS